MLLVIALQNLAAYSVNMADNIMLGSYQQSAVSGAAAVNQIFFVIQQFALAIGNALVVLASQYWGEKKVGPIRTLTGLVLKLGVISGGVILVVCMLFPLPLMRLFTESPEIIDQGCQYLAILQWTFPLFVVSTVLMAALRSVENVNISFYISLISLAVNVGINYTLIFGRFGFPRLGIQGAAIGTLTARILELVIAVVYLWKKEKNLRLFSKELFQKDQNLSRNYRKVAVPIIISQMIWSISVPMQTAILGHLSEDAIAANSVASTFYQYLKVIVTAMASTSAVMIGNAIGRGNIKRIRSDARTLSVIDILIGLALGGLLILLRHPLLSMYNLTEAATEMALNLIVLMGVVMVGMSYQMPVSVGIIQGGGDTKFTLKMNMISTWGIVMPLSFMAAFWWKWPVEAVVLVIQSDQLFKGIPTLIHFRKYQWMKKLTK